MQYREIIPRKKYQKKSDAIVQFHWVFIQHELETTLVAVVKLRSKSFDLYYSGQRVYTSKKGNVSIVDLFSANKKCGDDLRRHLLRDGY